MGRLLKPYPFGPIELENRMVMSPMIRCRAGEGGVPTALNATYYQQRAAAGLIIAEGTQISAQGVGYPATLGIHSPVPESGRRTGDRVSTFGRATSEERLFSTPQRRKP